LKIITVVGARPQFIKAAPVSRALRAVGHIELLVHTGQHYDYGMSQVFFAELDIPEPAFNLGVGSGEPGRQTGEMLIRLEEVLTRERPDWVIVHGDTNTTLAGALAACKLGIPLAHNEAGMRSHNRTMPEEHNRVLTDHCSNLLFCATRSAVEELAGEGITRGVHLVGDVMYDAALYYADHTAGHSQILNDLNLTPGGYLLATLHRAYNTDEPARLLRLMKILDELDAPVILPLHPRTRKRLDDAGFSTSGSLRILEPLGYLDMVHMERHSRMILTDSGGVQREAYFFGIPCLTLRPETEWVETVQAGWNRVVDTDECAIRELTTTHWWSAERPPLFGDGKAAEKIVTILSSM